MTTWIKTSDVTRMLENEIKAKCGIAAKSSFVTKKDCRNIVIDVSDCSGAIVNQINAIAEQWRSWQIAYFGNCTIRHYFTMYKVKSPFTGFPVIWNDTYVHCLIDNGYVINEKIVTVQYEYINIQSNTN